MNYFFANYLECIFEFPQTCFVKKLFLNFLKTVLWGWDEWPFNHARAQGVARRWTGAETVAFTAAGKVVPSASSRRAG